MGTYSVIYTGSFVATDDSIYRVVFESSEAASATPRELTFSDAALTIEWKECDKMEVLRGSSATIKVISDIDRRFIDLYTIKRGAIRCKIYRDDSLYWCGTLDAEQYEEPYSYGSGYEVSLTFSDFGMLKYTEWGSEGLVSIRDIIAQGVNAAKIDCLNLDLNSSTQPASGNYSIFDCLVSAVNFYDENREPMSLYDVLEETLKPFGLMMRQKSGNIKIFDLNGLNNFSSKAINWTSDDAVLSVDKVYNKVNLAFSPYAENPIVDGSLDHDKVLSGSEAFNIRRSGASDVEFSMAVGYQAGLPLEKSAVSEYFRIDAGFSGEDCAGVALLWTKGEYESSKPSGSTHPNVDNRKLIKYGSTLYGSMPGAYATPVLKSPLGFVRPGVTGVEELNVKLDVILDYKLNPFDSEHNDQPATADFLANNANSVIIPCSLKLIGEDGYVLYHYSNRSRLEHSRPGNMGQGSIERWMAGAGSPGDFILMYYRQSSPKTQYPFDGWTTNRRSIIPQFGNDDAPDSGEGETIPLPPVSGQLQLEVFPNAIFYKHDKTITEASDRIVWALYKNPRIELCNINGKDYEPTDVTISAWLNKDAANRLDIETKVGTDVSGECPSGRGILMSPTKAAVGKFSRAGVTDALERLLIGTIYSQHAQGHTVLSGTAQLIAEDCVLTDDATDGLFFLVSETQNLREAESKIVVCELSDEDYEGMEVDG